MIICFDMDHTLVHAAWRDEHMPEDKLKGNWDHYHSLGVQDKPSIQMFKLAIALMAAGHNIYIVTARPQKWARQTYAYLHRNGLKISFENILMRDYDNYQPSHETKLMLTEHLAIDLFIDDNTDNIEAFAKIGVTTLLVRLVS